MTPSVERGGGVVPSVESGSGRRGLFKTNLFAEDPCSSNLKEVRAGGVPFKLLLLTSTTVKCITCPFTDSVSRNVWSP